MRAALHVLATLMVVPYVILAIGFVMLGDSISSGSLLSELAQLLVLLPGMLVLAVGAWLSVAARQSSPTPERAA